MYDTVNFQLISAFFRFLVAFLVKINVMDAHNYMKSANL